MDEIDKHYNNLWIFADIAITHLSLFDVKEFVFMEKTLTNLIILPKDRKSWNRLLSFKVIFER